MQSLPRSDLWTWVFRIVLALAALAAPIIVFHLVTDPDVPDPQKQQRLREISQPAAEPRP